MISRYTEKNKYGGYTWQIKIDSIFHIYINGTDSKSFVVEFKEKKWIKYSLHFSFVSDTDFQNSIVRAFERIFDFFQENEKYSWTIQQKEEKLSEVLEKLGNMSDPITLSFLKNHYTKDKITVIKISTGSRIDDNVVNMTTARIIIDKYGYPREEINHNNYSMEMTYPQLGMSFFYKLNDHVKLIYLMMATGEVPAIIDETLFFDNKLTLKQVFEIYGMSQPKGIDDSSEAVVSYPGIIFYANLYDMTELQPDEIFIKKIAIIDYFI